MLSLLVDTKGPGPLQNKENEVWELLKSKIITTYDYPKDNPIALLLHRLSPELTYLTPPYVALRDGTMYQFIWVVVGFIALFALPYLGFSVIFLLLTCLGALAIRMIALKSAVGELQGFQPPVDVFEMEEHLVQAGNPIDLFLHSKTYFEKFRNKQFQNRILHEKNSGIGINAHSNSFQASLLLETQPTPLDDLRDTSRSIFILDTGGVALKCVGIAMLLWAIPFRMETITCLIMIFSAFLAFLAGANFRGLAQALACTFRFHSDLFLLTFEGSYMLNEVSIGSAMESFTSAKGQVMKSNIIAKIYAGRIISECGIPTNSYRTGIIGNSKEARNVLENSPWYILSSHLDEAMKDRLSGLINFLRNFQDHSEEIRTPSMSTEAVKNLVSQNLTMAQLMESAKAQGKINGEQQALQNMGGNALEPGGYLPVSLPISPQNPVHKKKEKSSHRRADTGTTTTTTIIHWKGVKWKKSFSTKQEKRKGNVQCPFCNHLQQAPNT